mgnify:CR=1 FL=1
MKRILIAEDEQAIREFEAINLKRVGYDVAEAGSGEEALDIYDNDPLGFDIALLDISMPGIDGFTVCKELRKRSETLGIIMLTARTQEMDKISGLMLGADDYITKPFNIRELLGRVQAHLRRERRAKDNATDKSNGLKIDYSGMNVTFNGKTISFTKTEFEIIEFLSMNPGQVFDREKIYETVIGFNSDGDNTVITEHIRKIRNKFINAGCEAYIETVWGLGYKWIK